MRTLLAALIVLALPATAQELSDSFDVFGEMAVTLDGTEMVLPIALDLNSNASQAEIRPLYGKLRILSVSGVTATDAGGWDAPIINLIIQIGGFGQGTLMSIMLSEKGQNKNKQTVANIEFGSMDLPEFSISEDGTVEFRFSGELVRTVLDSAYNQTLEEGQPPVKVIGTVSMIIPEAYRVK